MKKVGILLILFLIVTLNIPSSVGYFLEDRHPLLKNIFIVDNEGDGDFISIKDALEHAVPGDTIEVYSGTYFEYNISIEINNITVIGVPTELGNGSDIGKPFINGEGNDDLIEIRIDNITIDGFRMENKGLKANGIISIFHEANHCIITNNDIAYTTMSCIWIFGSNNFLTYNNISHSTIRQGIALVDPSNNNIVRGNKISDCDTGILTWGSGNNLIENNIVQNCVSYGMDIGNSDNVVRYNTIENNSIGIQLMSIRTSVSNNNFINNEKYHATAYNSRLSWLISNRWVGNYWDRGRILPYPILCQFFMFPWIEFDWNPAEVPNSMS